MVGNFKSSERASNGIISTNPNNLSTDMEVDSKTESIARKSKKAKIKSTIEKLTRNKCILLVIILSILLIILLTSTINLLIIIFKTKDCQNGYYHPIDEINSCYKCEIQNCKNCGGQLKIKYVIHVNKILN